MAENTKIEWAHHTWSPWEGCQKTGSLACAHCYAEVRNARFGGGEAPNWGPHAPRRLTADGSWRKPWSWDRAAASQDIRLRVFPSLCDPFDNKAPEGARARFANMILGTPNLDWLLLTKRIGNAADMLVEMFPDGTPANVWLGATVVTQAEADRDIPKLLATPAAKRFLSMEPLMEAVDLRRIATMQIRGAEMVDALGGMAMDFLDEPVRSIPKLDWVIVGGESGPGARPMHPDWARSLRDQCSLTRTPFLFKQWGEWLPIEDRDKHGFNGFQMIDHLPEQAGSFRPGKKSAGRLLDGVQHDGVPA